MFHIKYPIFYVLTLKVVAKYIGTTWHGSYWFIPIGFILPSSMIARRLEKGQMFGILIIQMNSMRSSSVNMPTIAALDPCFLYSRLHLEKNCLSWSFMTRMLVWCLNKCPFSCLYQILCRWHCRWSSFLMLEISIYGRTSSMVTVDFSTCCLHWETYRKLSYTCKES